MLNPINIDFKFIGIFPVRKPVSIQPNAVVGLPVDRDRDVGVTGTSYRHKPNQYVSLTMLKKLNIYIFYT